MSKEADNELIPIMSEQNEILVYAKEDRHYEMYKGLNKGMICNSESAISVKEFTLEFQELLSKIKSYKQYSEYTLGLNDHIFRRVFPDLYKQYWNTYLKFENVYLPEELEQVEVIVDTSNKKIAFISLEAPYYFEDMSKFKESKHFQKSICKVKDFKDSKLGVRYAGCKILDSTNLISDFLDKMIVGNMTTKEILETQGESTSFLESSEDSESVLKETVNLLIKQNELLEEQNMLLKTERELLKFYPVKTSRFSRVENKTLDFSKIKAVGLLDKDKNLVAYMTRFKPYSFIELSEIDLEKQEITGQYRISEVRDTDMIERYIQQRKADNINISEYNFSDIRFRDIFGV